MNNDELMVVMRGKAQILKVDYTYYEQEKEYY